MARSWGKWAEIKLGKLHRVCFPAENFEMPLYIRSQVLCLFRLYLFVFQSVLSIKARDLRSTKVLVNLSAQGVDVRNRMWRLKGNCRQINILRH